MYVIAYPLLAVVSILDSLLFVYSLVVIASVIMSWVNADPYNPIVRTVHMLTDPAIRKIRQYVKPIGAIDLAPMVLILGILFIQRGILPIISTFASSFL